jgi:hypothetical protein
MRKVGAGMSAAVLLAGLATSAASAQYGDGDLHSAPPTQKTWWDGWFTAAPKPPAHKPETGAAPAPAAPAIVETAAAAHKRERAALDRRQEVCDRLMEIAVRNNDEAMQTQIEQLRDRAWEVYQQRTAALSTSTTTPDPARKEKP